MGLKYCVTGLFHCTRFGARGGAGQETGTLRKDTPRCRPDAVRGRVAIHYFGRHFRLE